jgi:hypothetical protein
VIRDGIRYEVSDADLLRQTVPVLKRTRDRLFFHFGAVNDSGLRVIVAASNSAFAAETGPHFPDWGVGAADIRTFRIVLRAPGSGGWPHSYAQVVAHEYAHIYLHLLAGPRARIPRWLNEGFAMHAAFEWGVARHLRLMRASWTGSLLNLSEMEAVNRFQGEKAALAYTQAFAAYQFLQEQHGREGVQELLRALGRGLSMDQAFWQALGSGYPDFQGALHQHLEEQANVMALVFDSGFIWGLLALLFVAGWLIKKYRSRAIERRWQIEDRIHGEADFNEYVDPDDDESWRSGA